MTTQAATGRQEPAASLPTRPATALALEEIEAQARYNALAGERIAAAIRDHMKPGIHYTYRLGDARFDRPVLLDAGIAFLQSILRLVPRHHVELAQREVVPVLGPDGTVAGHRLLIKYVVRAELWHISADGDERLVAEGLGSASSFETRHLYRWVGERDLPPGIDPSHLVSRGRGDAARYRVYNTDPDDLDNTILKIAAKRAEADAIRQLPGVLEACALLPDVEAQASGPATAPAPSAPARPQAHQPPPPARPSPTGRAQAAAQEATEAETQGRQAQEAAEAPRPRRRAYSQADLEAHRRLIEIAQQISPSTSWYVAIACLLGLPAPERGLAAIEEWLAQGHTWQDVLARAQEAIGPAQDQSPRPRRPEPA